MLSKITIVPILKMLEPRGNLISSMFQTMALWLTLMENMNGLLKIQPEKNPFSMEYSIPFGKE